MDKRIDMFALLQADAMHRKCYEPEPRNKDGFRHVRHRFEIKGGISAWDMVCMNVAKHNALYQRLTAKVAKSSKG